MAIIAVITVSDRCASGKRADMSGPLASQLLSEYGTCRAVRIVPDSIPEIRQAIREELAAGADIICTTGGTGFSTRDVTPEACEPLVTKRAFGVEQAVLQRSSVPTAILSRSIAGVCEENGHRAFLYTAPGSTGGVKDAVAVIGPLITHIVEQLADGDHTHHDVLTPHELATRRIQNRGVREGKDAAVVTARVSSDPIDTIALAASVESPQAGAIVSFDGRVRNHDDGQGVTSIDYEAHPEAEAVVQRIAAACAHGSDATKLAVIHRSGHLEVGDVAFAVAASAPHRREAFDLVEKVVENVKNELPVWKKQEFSDGTHQWTGSA